VSDPRSGVIVRDAQVEIALTKGGTSLTKPATHEDAGNAVDYAAHIDIAEEGSWSGVVKVTGPAGVSEAPFLQQVTAPRTLTTVILVGIPFAAMAVVFVAMWLVRTHKGDTEKTKVSQALNK
jgi:hypothetical protein